MQEKNFDIKKIVNSQRDFFSLQKSKEIEFRIGCLKKLKQSILKNETLIADALFKDFKRSQFESYATETGTIIEEINLAVKNLSKWAKPIKVKTPLVFFSSESEVDYEPYGVVLIIGAWNYPFALSLAPLIGAISAGNCAIVKPSEISPNSSKVITKIINESFEPCHVLAIEGGVETATKLLNERFDYIFFTGGVGVGKIVAKAAAKNLTPITLELGGKSPCIIDDTVSLKTASKRIIWSKFINAGQTCVAPDYLLVKKDIKQEVIKCLIETINEFYGESPRLSPDYCRIVNKAHFERLEGFLASENIIFGGKKNKKDFYISPTIIDNVKWGDEIMKEEIFGPILPIIEYVNLDEAIEMINKKEKSLAVYLFSNNELIQNRIINETSSGGICLNATILHTSNMYLPFGGVGNSGIGNYHGKFSFETFSHKKAVMKKSFWPELDVSYPPYKNKLSLLKKIWGDGIFK